MLVSVIQQNESAISIHRSSASWAFLPPTHLTPLRCHTAPGWAPHIIYNFALAICGIHGTLYLSVPLSIHSTLSFPCCIHITILYICVSIPALQIGSQGPFSIFHVYAWIYTLFLFLTYFTLCNRL